MSEPPKKYRHCSRMRRLIEARKNNKDAHVAEVYWPPGYLDSLRRAPPPLIRNELIKVEPMKIPDLGIFKMDSVTTMFDTEAEEDILCHKCEKVIIVKGAMMSSVPKTTRYLGHAEGGGTEYICHDCNPPKARKLIRIRRTASGKVIPWNARVNPPRPKRPKK